MSSIKLDFFLDDPDLRKKHEAALPTNEMYRFFPPQEEILMTDSSPENNYRFIFNGQPKTDYENKKLSKFQEYENTHGKLNYPSDWLESDTMRLLQASEYDIKKTYKSIQENIQFRNSSSKIINNKILSVLNSGCLYVFGRDHHFRPIIIVSLKTCKNLISKKNMAFGDISESIIYLVNYILKYMLVPGQIENWVIFVDFKDIGLSDMSEFKKILSVLNKYRGRVYRNYIVNIGGFLKVAVKAALKVFGSASSKKLKILGSDELNKLQEIISADNIQKKYGGSAPDIIPEETKLFPPIMPSDNYAINGEKLNIISENAYKEMCLYSKPFKPFVISPKYEKLWKEENEKDSTKSSIKEAKNEKKENVIKEKNVLKKEIKSIQSNRIKEIKRNENNLMIRKSLVAQNQRKINEFLNEFERFDIMDNYEEKIYFNCTPLNFPEINCFFNKLRHYKKVCTPVL